MLLKVTLVSPRTVGKGTVDALIAVFAKSAPKMDTIDPGAIGIAAKLAALIVELFAKRGGLVRLANIARTRLFTRSAM
jgi:hypothetical protein